MSYLSVVIPAFNEQENLPGTVSVLQGELRDLVPSYEIIIVDDGSLDKTGEFADALAKASSNVRAYHHKRNLGIGRGFVTGVAGSEGEWILLIPADLAINIEDLHKYIDLASECDVVVGLATSRSDSSITRKLVSFLNVRAVQLLFGMRERQFQYICLYRASALKNIDIEYADSAFFHAEILIKAKTLGYRLNEVEVSYSPRHAGHATGAGFRKVIKTAVDMVAFRIRWITEGKVNASSKRR